MLLEGKNGVVYGGGGSMGGAVARAFGHEGASVFLAGRTLSKLDAVAEEIVAPAAQPRPRSSTPSTGRRSRLMPTPSLAKPAAWMSPSMPSV